MEPMNLGSPVSSMSSNQSQYLPCYLMGDGPGSTTPPRVGGVDFGAQSSPFVYPVNSTAMPNTSLDFGRSPLAGNSLFGGGYHQQHSNVQPLSNIENFQNTTPAKRKNVTNSQAGPPIQGLFDSLRNNQLAVNSSKGNLQNESSLRQQINEGNMSNTQNNYSDSMRIMCSPLGANLSPIGMGVSNTPSKELAAEKHRKWDPIEYWVTVFGFPLGATTLVLQHFQMFGTVVGKVMPPQNCNWMHIKFSARIECDRAIQFNQKIIQKNIMIGVTRCIDLSVNEKENFVKNGPLAHDVPYRNMRPLAQQGIDLAENEILVENRNVVAHRSNGLIDKAMDLLFNW